MTVARRGSSRASASIARRARISIVNPRPTFSTRTAAIATASVGSAVIAATPAAITNSATTTLRNCATSSRNADSGGLAGMAFSPAVRSRSAASRDESPPSVAWSAPRT